VGRSTNVRVTGVLGSIIRRPRVEDTGVVRIANVPSDVIAAGSTSAYERTEAQGCSYGSRSTIPR